MIITTIMVTTRGMTHITEIIITMACTILGILHITVGTRRITVGDIMVRRITGILGALILIITHGMVEVMVGEAVIGAVATGAAVLS